MRTSSSNSFSVAALSGGGGTRNSCPEAMTQVFQLPACGPAGPACCACAGSMAPTSSVTAHVITRMALLPLGRLATRSTPAIPTRAAAAGLAKYPAASQNLMASASPLANVVIVLDVVGQLVDLHVRK